MLERVVYICVKECLMDCYPKGLASVSVPLLFSLFEEVCPTLSSTPDRKLQFSPDDFSGLESKLFWMLYLFCEDHQGKSVLEEPGALTSSVEELLLLMDSELHTHFKSHQVRFDAFRKWISSFLIPRFRQLPLLMLLWDKYMTNLQRLPTFHAYVCAVLILFHRDHLLGLSSKADLQKFISHPLQNPWKYEDMAAFLALVDKHYETLQTFVQ
jgi:hypothetical protein